MSQRVVYTAGVFDMFHIGHLNLLRRAKGLGDRLVVAVSTDDLVAQYKSARPMMSHEDRIQIVAAIRYVDICIPQHDRDKFRAWERIGFNVLAVGDDWRNDPSFRGYETRLKQVGVRTVYLPYTQSISSSRLRQQLEAIA